MPFCERAQKSDGSGGIHLPTRWGQRVPPLRRWHRLVWRRCQRNRRRRKRCLRDLATSRQRKLRRAAGQTRL